MVIGNEERKRDEYAQVLAFWRWLKEQPYPKPEQDGFDPIWQDIVNSMKDCWETNGCGDLLRCLLSAGVEYLNIDWKRRKTHE